MLAEVQKQNSCNCNTWEAECELGECRRVITSCCFTQQQVLEVNCHPAREKEPALGAIRKHAGRFQEAHMVLPVLLSAFSVRVRTVTFPGPVTPSFNPFVLTSVLGSHLSAQAEGTGHGGSLDAWTSTAGSPPPGQARRKLSSTHKRTRARRPHMVSLERLENLQESLLLRLSSPVPR